MPVVRQAWPSLAVGGISGAAGGVAAVVAFLVSYLALREAETSRASAQLLLAMAMFFIPMAAGIAAFIAAVVVLDGPWGASMPASIVVAGVLLAAVAAILVPLVSAVNDCEFTTAFPLTAYDSACD
jgi:putative effector of murein hydrolase LrgA (UPF0299 family)